MMLNTLKLSKLHINLKTLVLTGLFITILTACDKTPEQHKNSLTQQSQQQGYPVLVATPKAADYALPFCEKNYCIDVDIATLSSTDPWFDSTVQARISDLIRQQLQIKQKLTLQQAVDAFVQASDNAQNEKKSGKQAPWALHIRAQLAAQQQQLALVILHADFKIPSVEKRQPTSAIQSYYLVLDRKAHRIVRLYDVIDAKQRIAFNQFIQTQYQLWRTQQSADNQTQLPEKVYWANQDWFFDTQGIAVVYRTADWGITGKDFVIYLTPELTQHYLAMSWRQLLQLT